MEEELTNWGHLYLFAKRTLSASKKAIVYIALHDKQLSAGAMSSEFLSETGRNDSFSSLAVLCRMVLYFFYTSLCVSRIDDMYQNAIFWPYLAATPSKSTILQNFS